MLPSRASTDIKVSSFSVLQSNLNQFMSLDKSTWLTFRKHLQQLLSHSSPLTLDTTITATNVVSGFKAESHIGRRLFVSRTSPDTTMCLPCQIGDYTDFYSSLEHAYNCGVLIRGKEKALQPNWKHLPVAYHGRASSIVPSGTSIHRPMGQRLRNADDTQPVIEPCARLDFELEVGFVSTLIGRQRETLKIDEYPLSLLPQSVLRRQANKTRRETLAKPSSRSCVWSCFVERLVCSRYSDLGICSTWYVVAILPPPDLLW